MAQTPFLGDAIDHVRYVWDPVVHEFLNEDCFFLLLRLREFNDAIVQQIDQVLAGAGITGGSIYLLFGDWDVLLRLWMPGHALGGLTDALTAKLNVDRLASFTVAEIDYSSWSGAQARVGVREVVSNLDHMEVLCSENPSMASAQAALEALHQAHLVHVGDPTGHFAQSEFPILKVYIGLKAPTTGSNVLEHHVREQISAAFSGQPLLRLVSLYFGRGDVIDCLVKALIPAVELPKLGATIFRLQGELRAHQLLLRPFVLIVANNNAREKDFIELDPTETRKMTRLLESLVSSEASVLLAQLSRHHYNRVVELFEEFYRQFLETPLEADFIGIIESGLPTTPDARALAKNCHFLIEMQRTFRDVVFGELRAVAPQPIAEPGTHQAGELNLDQCLKVLEVSVDKGRLEENTVATRLGEGWRNEFGQAASLLNDLMGDRIRFVQNGSPLEQWARYVRRALSAGNLYLRLIERDDDRASR